MVTIGIRVEPEEREKLEALAAQNGQSLCAFLRDHIRRELAQIKIEKPALRACS